jgi:hypothetical protein
MPHLLILNFSSMTSSFAVSKHHFSTSRFRLAGFCFAAFLASFIGGCTDNRDGDNTGSSGTANQTSDQSNEHESGREGENEREGMGMDHGRNHADGMDTMRRSGRAHSRGMGMMDKEKRR